MCGADGHRDTGAKIGGDAHRSGAEAIGREREGGSRVQAVGGKEEQGVRAQVHKSTTKWGGKESEDR